MTVRHAELMAGGAITLIGVFFITFSIPIYSVAIGAGPGSGAFPLLVGIVQLICGLVYLRNALRLPPLGPFVTAGPHERRWLWQCLLSVVVYVAAMGYLGFALTTFLWLSFHLKSIGEYRARFYLPFAAAVTVACVYLFEGWLYVPLPKGLAGW